MTRWDIINDFIEKYNYKSYLEIGYYKGWSFDNVNCERKMAVDPNPCQTQEQQRMVYGSDVSIDDKHLLYKQTSNDFFAYVDQLEGGEEDFFKFDLIFIDGLHEANQVYTDIKNALNHLSPGGTIVLHDCNPPTLLHATTGDKSGNWNGDVYKAFVKFRSTYPEYETYTIDTDWGCGVIRAPADTKNTYIDGLYKGEDINVFLNNWDKFDENRAGLLNLISVEEFIKKNHEEIKNHNVPA